MKVRIGTQGLSRYSDQLSVSTIGAHRGPVSLTLVRRRRGMDGSPRHSNRASASADSHRDRTIVSLPIVDTLN